MKTIDKFYTDNNIIIKDCFWKENNIQLDTKGCMDHKEGSIKGKRCLCQSELCNKNENDKTNEESSDEDHTNGVQGSVPHLAIIMTFFLGYLAM